MSETHFGAICSKGGRFEKNMAISVAEIGALQEREPQSKRLLWLPVNYPLEPLAREDFWRRTHELLASARNYIGTVRLYPQGIYPELISEGSVPVHDSFDQNYQEFDMLARLVEETTRLQAKKTPGIFDQWNIIHSLLGRKGSTWIEVCDDEQRCLRIEAIEREIGQAPDRHKAGLKRLHLSELGDLGRGRRSDFARRIRETLKPGELGVLILGADDFAMPGIEIESPLMMVQNGTPPTPQPVLQRL